jgi:hypothetical protein
MGCDLAKYLNVIDLSPSTYWSWALAVSEGTMVEKPDQMLSAEQIATVKEIRHWLRDHAMNERSTYGLRSLWKRFRDKISRELYRKIAEEVRLDVNRELRNKIQRYEFNFPDVAHSLDFKHLPKDETNWRLRYLIRIFDDCTRLTLKKAITHHKGAGVGLEFVWGYLRENPNPLAFKYDWEFVTPRFESMLLDLKIAPLPNPRRYPQANGKHERANRDVQEWFGIFGDQQFWTYNELEKELDFCFAKRDDIEARAQFGGNTRRKAYQTMPRAKVDRGAFFKAAVSRRAYLLRRSDNMLTPTDAWRVATKETLKQYGLVRYLRPEEVSRDFKA